MNNFLVKTLEYSDILKFDKLFYESFPKLSHEIQAFAFQSLINDPVALFKLMVAPAIDDNLLIILCDGDKQIGYEFVSLSPHDKTKVVSAFTYISEEYRGLKLSHLLRQKMFELLKNKNIKKFYFTINNANIQSTNNLKNFSEKFKITEVSKTYLVEL
jgi:hypothetical protein